MAGPNEAFKGHGSGGGYFDREKEPLKYDADGEPTMPENYFDSDERGRVPDNTSCPALER